ncbi:hypothetical protein [Devosia sp.]|uniref:hypothetical protein n=1 Tax=Devosia sp. TaxID=1871048 RepID=UPI003263BB3C
MSWVKLPIFDGQLKIKPYSQLRTVEIRRAVPIVRIGAIYISFWNRETIEREDNFLGGGR